MMPIICCVQDFLTAKHKDQIRQAAEAGPFDVRFFETVEEAQEILPQAEVIYCPKVEAAVAGVRVKWFASSWAGVAPFLKPGVLPQGCVLTKGTGTYGVAISEYVVAMAINLLKRFPEYFADMNERRWTGGRHIGSIYGSRVTVIGTGDIGQNIALRMRALGASHVTGINYSGRNPEDRFDEILRFTEIEAALPETDILACCAPDTPETTGMLSRERLSLLPETAVLINVGRGTLLDQDALIEMLQSDRLMGAALDVMVPEPLPADHPLWTAKRCILTPHISGFMTLDHTADQAVANFCENIRRYANGEPLNYQVDFEKGY